VLFQTLDDKKRCHGIYQNGNFYYNKFPEHMTKSWGYTPYLKGKDVDYAFLFTGGQTLGEVCPEHLEGDWARISSKMKAFIRSFSEAKISLDDVCFYDLVPENFLIELCEIKNRICEHVFEEYEKPENYDFLCDLSELIDDISQNKINFDESYLKNNLNDVKVRGWLKKVRNCYPYVNYNIFGTITGRLSAQKNSFPILTLPRLYRRCIKPTNDWFLELDFNAAELRTVLALSGIEQPQEDIHAWNAKNIYAGKYSREESKRKIISWLYNPAAGHYTAARYYNRDMIREEYWDGEYVKTPFLRTIRADYDHALNYTVQSTTSDITLRQAVKISNLLKDKKSYIAFCLHDSIVVDLSFEDKDLIKELVQMFADTDLGKYYINASIGKNFGALKKINNDINNRTR
jgi:hypothetical protein|tara:strand:- start:2431 stop:3639 length:1209 start_codon:yes stop_codon:yes gene_type:complete